MFYGLLVGIHVLVGFLMMLVILMQASKGGGLSGAFGTGAGSSPLFGAATSTVLVRTTTVLAIIFAITCLSIAAIQSKRASLRVKTKKGTEKVSTTTGSGMEARVGPEESAPEEKEQEGGVPSTKTGAEGEEKSAAEGEKPSPPEEKPLSPVEAEGEGREKGPAEGEEPSLPEEKALSPVEARGAEE